jgi:FkbM family methyltransferase
MIRQEIPDMPVRFELSLRKLYEATVLSGSTVVDCGAHTGKHSIPLAQAVGQNGMVYAFEANRDKAKILYKKAQEAGVERQIKLSVVALGDKYMPSVKFFSLPTDPGKSGLQLREGLPDNIKVEEIDVEMVMLDDVIPLNSSIGFIKTDVEGAELLVLRGGQKLIQTSRPIIHFECGAVAYRPYGITSVEFFTFFNSMDYMLLDILGNTLTDVDDWLESDAAPGVYDYIAMPKESSSKTLTIDILRRFRE